jgi:hypothetical protein
MKLVSIVTIAVMCSPSMAATIPVRFAEGLTRGYLVLKDTEGTILAHGDLLQIDKGKELDKRMVFRFKDGSLYDERVTFTEKDVFQLKSYRLTTRGPSFDADTEITMNPATGAYRVATTDHKDGKEKVLEGTLEMPDDVYNGLIITVVKDFPKGKGETIHFVAFTPDPKIIGLEMTPDGEHDIMIGDLKQKAVHYRMKPRLGFWMKFFAKLKNRMPSDLHAWVATDDVPAFVGFEGQMSMTGPVWRIEVVSPSVAR